MRRLGMAILVGSALYGIGLSAGFVLSTREASPATTNTGVADSRSNAVVKDVEKPHEPQVPEPTVETEDHETLELAPVYDVNSAASMIRVGDDELLSSNPRGALDYYEHAASLRNAELLQDIRYRIGICAEALGDFDRAMAEYRQVASKSHREELIIGAMLGQARTWNSWGKPLLARKLLWRFVLGSEDRIIVGEDDLAECTHRLGQLLAQKAMSQESDDLLDDAVLAIPPATWSPTAALIKLQSTQPRAVQVVDGSTSESSSAAIEVTERFGDQPQEIYLSAQLPRMPVASGLELIAGKAGFDVTWSPTAREQVSETTTSLDVDGMTLAIVLDGLLDPKDLIWAAIEGQIYVQSREEVEPSAATQLTSSIATRLLRRAITLHPDHALTPEGYWALGNLSVVSGSCDNAIRDYQQFLRLFPGSRLRAGVHFNMGKLHMREGDYQQALQQLYHAVDEGFGTAIQPTAYLYVGRLLLEDDCPKQAVRALTRAVSLAAEDDLRTRATTELATAYLLAGQPHAANDVLVTNRDVLRLSPQYDVAALLGALARFRSATSALHAAKEGRSMIAALTHVSPEDFFGGHGYLLLASTYGELELLDKMRDQLLAGLEHQPHGGLRGRLLAELAEYHRRVGDQQRAVEVLRSAAFASDSRWAVDARLQLANMLFSMGDDEQCLELCYRLLAEIEDDTVQATVLKTMGRVLERQGNYRGAALCYSGTVPGESVTNSSEARQ